MRRPRQRHATNPGAAIWSVLTAASLAMASGCGRDASSGSIPSEDVVAVVAADPLFGGGAALQERVTTNPEFELRGDPEERERFFADSRRRHDDAASALVMESVSAELAHQVLPFLESEAGRAMTRAEAIAWATYPWGDEFPQMAAERFGDPERVGPHATREVERGYGSNVSPLRLALTVGARNLTPEQAASVGAFWRSDVGRRWLDVRTDVFARVDERYLRWLRDAEQRGFVRTTHELEDLMLPEAEFAAPEPEQRR